MFAHTKMFKKSVCCADVSRILAWWGYIIAEASENFLGLERNYLNEAQSNFLKRVLARAFGARENFGIFSIRR